MPWRSLLGRAPSRVAYVSGRNHLRPLLPLTLEIVLPALDNIHLDRVHGVFTFTLTSDPPRDEVLGS